MDKKDQPIEIVGAGPSGLVAAITLAHHGYSVVVHEERSLKIVLSEMPAGQ